jgi:hypothetical protein
MLQNIIPSERADIAKICLRFRKNCIQSAYHYFYYYAKNRTHKNHPWRSTPCNCLCFSAFCHTLRMIRDTRIRGRWMTLRWDTQQDHGKNMERSNQWWYSKKLWKTRKQAPNWVCPSPFGRIYLSWCKYLYVWNRWCWCNTVPIKSFAFFYENDILGTSSKPIWG